MRAGARALASAAVGTWLLGVGLAQAVELRVVDQDGAAIAGVEIEVRSPQVGDGVVERMLPFKSATETDDRGRAVLTLPALDGLLALVDREGYLPLSTQVRSTSEELVFVLEVGVPITGRAVPKQGRERSTAEIAPSGERENGRRAGVDAETPQGVSDDDASAAGGDLEPAASGVAMRGRACASWNERFPSWGFEKWWRRCTELSDDGRFVLEGVPDQVVDLGIAAEGYLPLIVESSTRNMGSIRLERGLLVEGRVLTAATGKPIEGVAVREVSRSGARTRSGARGEFQLAIPPAGAKVSAEGPGYEPLNVEVTPKMAEGRLELRLEGGVGVTGIALVPDVEPPAGAKLFYEQRSEGETRSGAKSIEFDDAGRFKAYLPSAGEYALELSAAGLRSDLLGPVLVEAELLTDLGVIELSRGARISGRVASEESGEPIHGAELLLFEEGSNLLQGLRQRGVVREVSGREGAFEFAGLSAGAYQVRIRHREAGSGLQQVTLERDEHRELGTVWLRSGAEIRGRVTNRRGEPQSGVGVEFFDSEQALALAVASARTDPNGRFAGVLVQPGSYRVNVAGARLLATQTLVVPDEGQLEEFEITTDGVELSGLVRRAGIPVVGGWISFTSALDPGHLRGKIVLNSGSDRTVYGAPRSAIAAEVDDAGVFRVSEAPAGLLRATYLDARGTSSLREIRVPDTAEAFVEIEFGGAELTGRVRDADSGEGISGAELELLRPGASLGAASARSDPTGSFSFSNLELGRYALRVAAQGYEVGAVADVEVSLSNAALDIPLRSGDSKSLVIQVRRSDGAPAAGVMLSVLDQFGRFVAALSSDASGRREFRNLEPGRYHVAWSDGLAGAGISTSLLLRGEEKDLAHTLSLVPGVALALVCGAPECKDAAIGYLELASSVGIDISPYLSGVSSAMRFSAGERFDLGRVSPGTYFIRLGAGAKEWRYRLEAGREALAVRLE